MIQLTGNYQLFPPRVPSAPSLWGWWTVAALLLIIILAGYWWRKYRIQHKAIQESDSLEQENYTHQKWREDLQLLNTSVRTPDQKARAILVHMFRYYGIQTNEAMIPSLTNKELLRIPEIQPLLPFFQELYEMIYSGQKITHTTIHNFTTRLIKQPSGI